MWAGLLAGAYVCMMSVSGSLLVFRVRLETNPGSRLSTLVEWLVNVHENLLLGMRGEAIVGVGAICFTLLCVTGAIVWWPGIAHWRRSLTIHREQNFARFNWDLHNALGFWCFAFICLWGISGIYFAFPDPFNALVDFLQPAGASTQLGLGDLALQWLSNLHFGRFNLFTEILWSITGLVPAALVFSGLFMYGHRIFIRKGESFRSSGGPKGAGLASGPTLTL